MDIYRFLTNENGITSVRLVAIFFSLYPLDCKPQRRLIVDDAGDRWEIEDFRIYPYRWPRALAKARNGCRVRLAPQSFVNLSQELKFGRHFMSHVTDRRVQEVL